MSFQKVFISLILLLCIGQIQSQDQPVKWRDLISCSYDIATNTVTKVGASSSWDSGALSYNRLGSGESGSTSFTVTNVGFLIRRQLGLAKYNLGVSISNVDFCIRQLNTTVQIYENGTNVYSVSGHVQVNDILMIERTIGGSVVYSRIRSGLKTTIYTSAASINMNDILYVDAAMYRNGNYSKIADARCNFGYININKEVLNIDFYNGQCLGEIDVSIDSAVLPVTYLWSNGEVSEDIIGLQQGVHTLTVTDALNAVQTIEVLVLYYVKWDNIVSLNYNSSTNILTNNFGNGWTHGALSDIKLGPLEDGLVGIRIPYMTTQEHQMIGLSTYNTGAHFNTIEYAIYHTGSGVHCYESGSLVFSTASFGVSEVGDFYYVERKSSNIYYKRERGGETEILHTSFASVNPYDELYADCSIYYNNKTISNIFSSFGKSCSPESSYIKPSKTISGAIYQPSENSLKVIFPEGYVTNLSDCNVVISDELSLTNYNPISLPVKEIGRNRIIIDLTATVNTLVAGVYLMRFENIKGESLYLKFKI